MIRLTPFDGTLHQSHVMSPLLSTYCKYYNLIHTYIWCTEHTSHFCLVNWLDRLLILSRLSEATLEAPDTLILCVYMCVCVYAWLSVFASISPHWGSLVYASFACLAPHCPLRWKKHQGIQQQKDSSNARQCKTNLSAGLHMFLQSGLGKNK